MSVLAIPHLQVGKVRMVPVDNLPGVAPFNSPCVRTACGEDKLTTVTTRRPDLVRCPACLAAITPGQE